MALFLLGMRDTAITAVLARRWRYAASLVALCISQPLLAAGRPLTPPTYTSLSNASFGRTLTATNGGTFLTLWDFHGTYGSLYEPEVGLLKPHSFPVAPAYAMALTAEGDGYRALLVYGSTLRVVDLSRDGSVTASRQVQLGVRADAAIFSDSGLLIVSLEVAQLGSIAYFLSRDGSVLRGTARLGNPSQIAVAAVGNDFLITNTEANALFVWRFDASGRAIVAQRLITTTDRGRQVSGMLAVAGHGDDIAVAWLADLQTIRVVTTRGSLVLDSSQLGVCVLAIAWTGRRYVLVAQSVGRGSLAWTIDADASSASPPIPFTGGVSLAVSDGVIVAVGQLEQPAGLVASAFRENDVSLQPLNVIVLSSTLRQQHDPRLATDGFDALVTWFDRGDTNTHAAIRASFDGLARDPPQNDLGPAEHYGIALTFPSRSLAFGKTTYLTTWYDGANIVARRVAANGLPIDGAPFAIARGLVSDQAIAWDGRRWLVVWQPFDRSLVLGAFVSEQGEVASMMNLADGNGYGAPRVVWNGRQFVLTYTIDTIVGPQQEGPMGIAVVRVNDQGTPVDPNGESAAMIRLREPLSYAKLVWHVATSGRETLVVMNPATELYSTVAVSIHTDEAKLHFDDPEVVMHWNSSPQAAQVLGTGLSDVAWDGESYVIAIHYCFFTPHSVDTEQSWLAAIHYLPGVGVIKSSVVEARIPSVLVPPAVGVDAQRRALFVISSPESYETVDRLRAYTEDDMRRMPERPQAPRTVALAGNSVSAVAAWKWDEGEVAGFVVQAPDYCCGAWRNVAVAGPNDRSVAVAYVQQIRVRAFNAGGFSEPSIDTGFARPRRRAVR